MELVAILLAIGAGVATWFGLYAMTVALAIVAIQLHITATAQTALSVLMANNRALVEDLQAHTARATESLSREVRAASAEIVEEL